jgi:hypothetical protein
MPITRVRENVPPPNGTLRTRRGAGLDGQPEARPLRFGAWPGFGERVAFNLCRSLACAKTVHLLCWSEPPRALTPNCLPIGGPPRHCNDRIKSIHHSHLARVRSVHGLCCPSRHTRGYRRASCRRRRPGVATRASKRIHHSHLAPIRTVQGLCCPSRRRAVTAELR